MCFRYKICLRKKISLKKISAQNDANRMKLKFIYSSLKLAEKRETRKTILQGFCNDIIKPKENKRRVVLFNGGFFFEIKI